MNAELKTIDQQYLLNHFLSELLKLKKNIIQVANVNLNTHQEGAYIGDLSDLLQVISVSATNDVVVSIRQFGQLDPKIAKLFSNRINNPKAVTELRLAFNIGINQTITASYTLLDNQSAFDQHYRQEGGVNMIFKNQTPSNLIEIAAQHYDQAC